MTLLRRSLLATAAALALAFTAMPAASATSSSGTDSRPVSSRVFASDSPFYQKLPGSTPKASGSTTLIASLSAQAHKYYGTAKTENVDINASRYTTPLYVASNSDPVYDITAWNCQKKPGDWWYTELNRQLQNVHVPADALPDPSGDGSMSIYNPATRELVELWQARKVDGKWQACWGGKIDDASQSLGTFPQNYGVSAGGMAMWAYTIRAQELRSGHIDHVINLAIPVTKKGTYSWPANRTDGWASGTELSIGQMLRLPASLNIDAMKLSPTAKTIARAAQEYGVIISDTSGAVQFSAENSVGLATNAYATLFRGRWGSQEMAGNPALGEVPFPLDKLVALPINYMVPTTSPSDTDTPSTKPNTAYAAAVKAAKPSFYWRLGDTGSSAADATGNGRTGVLANVAHSLAGAIAGNPAIRTNGNAVSGAYRTARSTPTAKFSVQVWFKTTSSSGGKLVGFEDSQVSNGSRYDRSLYMTNFGYLMFGTYTGNNVRTVSSQKAYNDGAWHQATATQGTNGTRLYVDGVLVGSNTVNGAQAGSGYWRLAGGNLHGWPHAPTSYSFAGGLDECAVYPATLTAAQIAKLYGAAA